MYPPPLVTPFYIPRPPPPLHGPQHPLSPSLALPLPTIVEKTRLRAFEKIALRTDPKECENCPKNAEKEIFYQLTDGLTDRLNDGQIELLLV